MLGTLEAKLVNIPWSRWTAIFETTPMYSSYTPDSIYLNMVTYPFRSYDLTHLQTCLLSIPNSFKGALNHLPKNPEFIEVAKYYISHAICSPPSTINYILYRAVLQKEIDKRPKKPCYALRGGVLGPVEGAASESQVSRTASPRGCFKEGLCRVQGI